MKAYTSEEKNAAKRMAFRHIYGTCSIVLGHRFKYDHRTRIGKLAAHMVACTPINRNEIRAKRQARIANRPVAFRNAITSPIFVDYLKNKGNVHVYPDHLRIGSRNHWAKNAMDLKILQIVRCER